MLEYLGFCLIFFGVIAFIISAIGLVRMPDLYTRMHVGTKTTTIGTILVIIGVISIQPDWWAKLSLLIIFILITNPLSSSVVARASHNAGLELDSDEFKKVST